jgi:hypothetical protein
LPSWFPWAGDLGIETPQRSRAQKAIVRGLRIDPPFSFISIERN